MTAAIMDITTTGTIMPAMIAPAFDLLDEEAELQRPGPAQV
jgi:hypothetical protein